MVEYNQKSRVVLAVRASAAGLFCALLLCIPALETETGCSTAVESQDTRQAPAQGILKPQDQPVGLNPACLAPPLMLAPGTPTQGASGCPIGQVEPPGIWGMVSCPANFPILGPADNTCPIALTATPTGTGSQVTAITGDGSGPSPKTVCGFGGPNATFPEGCYGLCNATLTAAFNCQGIPNANNGDLPPDYCSTAANLVNLTQNATLQGLLPAPPAPFPVSIGAVQMPCAGYDPATRQAAAVAACRAAYTANDANTACANAPPPANIMAMQFSTCVVYSGQACLMQ
jgi:hypothetical protein